MPTCSRCGEIVESYGWNKKGDVVCVTCSNHEIITQRYIINGFPKLKELKVGDKVIDKISPQYGVATIHSIDIVNTLFGVWRHFLLQYPPESNGGYSYHWALEGDIEKALAVEVA